MQDIYIIGDVHGYYEELIRLINKLPNKFESKICFVGDLIDRGPDSKKVVDLVKKYNYDCVLGNHEQMCIDFNGNPYNMFGGYGQGQYNLFGGNGGYKTLESYDKLDVLQKDIKDFFTKLPLFKHYPEIKRDGKELLVTHSSCLNYINDISDLNSYDEFDIEALKESILWNRDVLMEGKTNSYIRESKKYFNIFGHTITDNIILNDKYASIETGVAKRDGTGKLSCLSFPSLKVYTS